ncbi:MAG: hypothetical protein A2728_00560 [Candidatus Spechtbacteria bacterium RIFCSPHIGHO2_01_FULL_38_11]|nr:MAG: hypothetical protein A2728_00560 [Candidatus Spechtbacteria bacterium RIFCSPHIGHO2_01_FULL_38_11]
MWFKIIFAGAIAIMLVVGTLTAVFGAGRVLKAVLETYVFDVENCRYDYKTPRPLEVDKDVVAEPEEVCEIDYNSAKREIANGIGMFVIFAPLAWFMFKQTRKMMNEMKA